MNEKLWEAIVTNDLEFLRRHVSYERGDIWWDDLTLLMHAARQDDDRATVKIVRLLLERRAYVDTVDSENYTALHVAASGGSAKIVHVLLEHGADPERITSRGETPLELTLFHGLEVFRITLFDAFAIRLCDGPHVA